MTRVRSFAAASLLGWALLLGSCGDSAPAAPRTSARDSPEVNDRTAAAAPDPTETVTAPALNWVLPIFTDREGYRSMTLRGSAVRPSGNGSIAVVDLNITIFSGEAAPKVDSILLSPAATFFPKESRASGEKAIRFIQDTIEVTGADWTYDHAAKKVSINRDVRVTFGAQLNDILK